MIVPNNAKRFALKRKTDAIKTVPKPPNVAKKALNRQKGAAKMVPNRQKGHARTNLLVVPKIEL
jgi:hypothetical protein